MSRLHATPAIPSERPEAYGLEGVATSVKILLKLINDHNETSFRQNDERKMHLVTGMMGIVDDVKTRIQKSQSFGKKRVAELRRCNTDLRPHDPLRDKRSNETVPDEKTKLRKELNSSLLARKSLEIMCSSLGKEKEIMALEILRKVQEMNEMEEDINDLRVQNEKLLAKVKACAAEHKEKKYCSEETQRNAAHQERNKVLSDQLLRSLDGYRSLKRRFKEAQQENTLLRATMEEMGGEVSSGIEQIREFRTRVSQGDEQQVNVEDVILEMEHTLEIVESKISKHVLLKSDCGKQKLEISGSEPDVT